jgi:hypothetical protein
LVNARGSGDPIHNFGRVSSNIALVLAALAVGVEVLWICSFYYGGSTQSARVDTFLSFFPWWLHGRWASWPHGPDKISTIQAALSVAAFFLSLLGATAMEKPSVGRRLANAFVLVVSPLMVLLKLFQSL